MSACRKVSSRLIPAHLADLRRSGLSDEIITAAGFYSLSTPATRQLIGMNAGPGYVIPYPGATHRDGSPYVRVRLDEPFPTSNGHTARYLTRKGGKARVSTFRQCCRTTGRTTQSCACC